MNKPNIECYFIYMNYVYSHMHKYTWEIYKEYEELTNSKFSRNDNSINDFSYELFTRLW